VLPHQVDTYLEIVFFPSHDQKTELSLSSRRGVYQTGFRAGCEYGFFSVVDTLRSPVFPPNTDKTFGERLNFDRTLDPQSKH